MTSYAFFQADTSFRAGDTRAGLDSLARFLDSAIRLPRANVRFGADAFLNLIPGVGTLTSKGMSAYLIWEAQSLGMPMSTLLRKASNFGVDFVTSTIPVVSWVRDAFSRSNLRNMAPLREHLDQIPIRRRIVSRADTAQDADWAGPRPSISIRTSSFRKHRDEQPQHRA